MAYNNLTFKKLDNGYYEAFFKGNSLSIFFKVPDGFDIRDYPISTYGPCKEIENESAYFELTKEPHETFSIDIATDAGLIFPKAFPIKIGSKLTLGSNKDMTIKTVDSPDLYFDALKIENNERSSIAFTPNKLKRLSQKELQDEGLDIEETIITSNTNVNFFINNNCSIRFINNLFTQDPTKNKIDLSKTRYIDISYGVFSPEQNYNNFSAISDLFIFHNSKIILTKIDNKSAKSSSIEMTSKNKGLTRIDMEKIDVSFFDGSTLEVDAKKLELGDRNSQKSELSFYEKNQLSAKEKIFTKESTFSDATINSENLELKIDGSAISKSSINFTGSSEKDNISKVEHATAFKSILNNISGDLRGTTISWMKANNITLGKNTSFYHTLLRDTWPKLDYLLNLDNITIAPDSSLHFDYGKDFARSLNNCYVEGKVSIESNCPYEINSSTIKNNNDEESTIFISSNGGNPLIESVLFNGDVEIKNVDELSYSEISNSKLLSPYRVNASNLFLCDETITNFDADNIEHKVDSTVTNELDIL